MNLLDAFKQYIRDAMPGGALNPEVTTQGVLDAAALGTAPVPIVGDAIGLAADVRRLAKNPEERTPLNFTLAGLGALPFVPGGLAGVVKGGKIADALNIKHGDKLDAYLMEGDRLNLSKVVVPKEARGSGVGSAFMEDLVSAADKQGKTVTLTPSSDFGGNKARLEKFYKRFGFVPNKGRTKDYEISEAMYRLPVEQPVPSVLRAPQAQALETAQRNAVTMLGLPPNNTAMDRAKALGFDTEAFHSTGSDFRSFQVSPYRGAVSVAATPSGAVSGAKAGQADMTGTGATSVMPLLMRSEGVQGLRLPADQERFLGSLPKVATESQVDDLMKSAPKGSFWGNFFKEVENADGSFAYVRKDAPKVSFQDVQKTKRGADGAALPNWGDERWSANRQKEIGGKGWLQADEAGISASIVDPSILRSRFAAFDPARVNENDLLGRADLGLLGLLAGGSAGLAYARSDKDKKDKK